MMRDWIKVTLLLCLFGLLREIRPSEPYVTPFILGPWRNITTEQLNQDIYPVGTYSYLSQLVLVFLVTDFLRFKPVIILSGICGIIVYSILLWTVSLEWLQVTQFFYGLYMATEVAYLTYMFAKVEPDKYPQVSSYTRMAALSGRFLSGVSAQLLTSFEIMDYRQLIYITFTAQILATFWALMLPQVQYSVYFHRGRATHDSVPVTGQPNSEMGTCVQGKETAEETYNPRSAFSLICRHARSAYSRGPVVVWSLFYAVALCLFVQVQSYIQVLWMDVPWFSDPSYFGAVEAVLTLFGALGAYLASHWRHNLLPAALAAVQALAVLVVLRAPGMYGSFVGYVVVGICFHYLITQASTKIASQLADESCFGLIFGINTLIGTGLQSILTFVTISNSGLALSIQVQFMVLCGGFALLSAVWFVGWLLYRKRCCDATSEENVLQPVENQST